MSSLITTLTTMTLINSDIDFPKIESPHEFSMAEQEAMDCEDYAMFLAIGDIEFEKRKLLLYNCPSMDPINHDSMPVYSV